MMTNGDPEGRLFCCFTSRVNSYMYGHCGTVSSPNHTFFLDKLEQAVNQYLVHRIQDPLERLVRLEYKVVYSI